MEFITISVMLNHEKHIILNFGHNWCANVQQSIYFVLESIYLLVLLVFFYIYIIKIENFEWLKPEWDSFKIRKFVTFPCMQCQKTTWSDELCARIIPLQNFKKESNAITQPRGKMKASKHKLIPNTSKKCRWKKRRASYSRIMFQYQRIMIQCYVYLFKKTLKIFHLIT
jgi:hypothetical protein